MAKAIVGDTEFFVSDGIISITQEGKTVVIVQANLDTINKLIAEDDAEMQRIIDEQEADDEQPDFGGQVGAENDAYLAQYD